MGESSDVSPGERPPRLPCVLTCSSNGFPCCGQKSVDIVEIPNYSAHRQHPPQVLQEEDIEAELLEQKPPPEEDLDSVPDLDLIPNLDVEPAKELETDLLQPELDPEAKANTRLDTEPPWQATNLDSGSEDIPQQGYKIESLHPCPEALPPPQRFAPWSYLDPAAEEVQGSSKHRSIRVQTSKHLFWADKLIQASEHSLQRVGSVQQDQHSQPLQCPNIHPDLPATDPRLTPNPSESSSPLLLPAIGLPELVSFASSLAVASSSKRDLPSLELVIKAPPQKAEEPSPEPAPPAVDKQDPEPRAEKPRAHKELPKGQIQEDKATPGHYLDFSKPGVKRANIEGEVELLQPPARSSQPQGAQEDSVPGTKKGNPLLLKIHFKLSSPPPPRND
ncbi:spermatogenesis-associated protein 32 [Lepus europaeus]|uniref:spermatogenesis-associated protein 32 n=1 Tax=Lepus europaeus TaxID=9983 RepID=UPI002B4682CC|nr:spermatogenesis-associated protein 32 [Lepus europaeus]